MKPAFVTHSFGPHGPALLPGRIVILRAELLKEAKYSPASYVQLAVNRQPGYRQGTRRAALLEKILICLENCVIFSKKDAPPQVVLHTQAM